MARLLGFIGGFVTGLVAMLAVFAAFMLILPRDAEDAALPAGDAPQAELVEAAPSAPSAEEVEAKTMAAETAVQAPAAEEPVSVSEPAVVTTDEEPAIDTAVSSVAPAPAQVEISDGSFLGAGLAPSEETAPAIGGGSALSGPGGIAAASPDQAPATAKPTTPQPSVMTSTDAPAPTVPDAAETQTELAALDTVSADPTTPDVAQPQADASPPPQDVPLGDGPEPETGLPQQPAAPSDETETALLAAPDTDTAPIAATPTPSDPAASDENADADASAAPPAAPILDGPAIEVLSQPFINEGRPLLAVVLQDVGDRGVERDNLTSFGKPVTFAVTPDSDDARWADDTYRKSGFEVVVMVPEGGPLAIGQRTATADVQDYMTRYFDAVPGAIGLIDRPLGDLYRNIRVVTEVTDQLRKSGRGLIVHERFGVNATLRVAAAKDVPSGTVMRVIDAERDPDVIRMALERATLEASKTGSAIVFGRTYPETITTLITWLLSNSARSISIAPLSAVIDAG